MEQVSQVVQTNSATSEECAAASVELSNQANRVRELISVYKLGDVSLGNSADIFSVSPVKKSEQTGFFGEGFGKY